jgi:hypothetical protein
MVGCSGDVSGGSTAAGLTIEEEAGLARGTFIDENGEVSFTSRFVDTNVLEIVVDFNGLEITSITDWDSGVIEHDGFSVDTAESTQMMDEDRAVLIAFTRSLDGLGTGVSEPVERLRAFVNTWSEYPTSLDLQGVALMDEDRGWESLCAYRGQWIAATHDCGEGCKWYNPTCSNGINSFWTDNTTLDYALLSMDGAGPCGDGTWFHDGYNWGCFEPGHVTNVEWGYGNCFGRCGDGCGGGTQFTRDCLNHDECVRTGHSDGSSYCNDQFSSASDDWAYAPNC